MSYASIMVYGKPTVHRRSAFSSPPAWPIRFNAALTGMSALAILPPLVIDGRVIDEMTGMIVKAMKVNGKQQQVRSVPTSAGGVPRSTIRATPSP